jgi:hypothetical protein
MASGYAGPKILFDFSQVEAGYPVLNPSGDLGDQGWTTLFLPTNPNEYD